MQRPPISTLLIVAGMCVVWVMFGSLLLDAARSHDFLNIYTGASLARDGHFADLHDVNVQFEREHRIFPGLPSLVPFVRPSFYAAVLAPLSLLSYRTAFVVWLATQIALLIACWIYGWWKFGPNALAFAAMFLPAPMGIASGQDCVLMLIFFLISYELHDRDRPYLSGAALGLMLIKFHLILLWPIALLLTKRWRMLAGFSVMAAVEIAISLALGGIQGAKTYIALLQNKSLDRLSPSPELMISQQGFAENLNLHAPWVIPVIAVIAIAAFCIAIWKAPTWRVFAATAVASLIIVPHVYGYDATLLLLPIWLVIFKSTFFPARFTATMLATPIPFGMALAGKPYAITSSAALLIFLGFLAQERFHQSKSST